MFGEQNATQAMSTEAELLHPDLSRVYCGKVKQLTVVFPDDALRAQAFERIRSLIDTVVLKPENGVLAIHLRGEFALMLELCVCPETQKASAGISEEALQIKMVAGTGFDRCRTRFCLTRSAIVSPATVV